MLIIVQDPSLVVYAGNECLGLFLVGDVESLINQSRETATNHRILLTLCLDGIVVIGVNDPFKISRRSMICLLVNTCISYKHKKHLVLLLECYSLT